MTTPPAASFKIPLPPWLAARFAWLVTKAAEGGIKLMIVVTVTVSAAGVVAVNVALPAAGVDTQPQVEKETLNVVPATGEAGFNAAGFCEHPRTRVEGFPAPDASGITYQLTRVLDGVSETVTAVEQASGTWMATHYWDEGGQRSEPAFVNAAAQKCIAEKVR